MVIDMSLLGPDDFGLSRKERAKRLAKDLSPAVQKEIDRLLDDIDAPGNFERLVELVGRRRAKYLTANRRQQKKDPERRTM